MQKPVLSSVASFFSILVCCKVLFEVIGCLLPPFFCVYMYIFLTVSLLKTDHLNDGGIEVGCFVSIKGKIHLGFLFYKNLWARNLK